MPTSKVWLTDETKRDDDGRLLESGALDRHSLRVKPQPSPSPTALQLSPPFVPSSTNPPSFTSDPLFPSLVPHRFLLTLGESGKKLRKRR